MRQWHHRQTSKAEAVIYFSCEFAAGGWRTLDTARSFFQSGYPTKCAPEDTPSDD
jgi:hypothetical protein